jgi:ABC-2 type transport system permease protein
MAVYKRGYQRYQGMIQGRWGRFMVLPRFAWQRLLNQRMVLLLLVVAMIWPLLCAAFIYFSNHSELLKQFSKSFQSFLEVNGNFFITFMNVQGVFAVFLAALAGPGLIAPDLENNALPLYFSRPLARMDYAMARLITLLGLLSLITWIPGLLLFGMQAGMAGDSWFRTNWRLGPGIIAGFCIWILLVSLVALASSAYARVRVVAGGIVLGFFFILSGASVMINGIFRATWGYMLNPNWATHRLWYALLAVEAPTGPGVPACVLTLSSILLLLVFVLERKLRPVEVVS